MTGFGFAEMLAVGGSAVVGALTVMVMEGASVPVGLAAPEESVTWA